MAVRASFADPYLAILRDDSSLLLLQADDSGDLDEVDIHESIISTKWLSCCLYKDTSKAFSPGGPTSESPPQGGILLFLLSLDCRLFVSYGNKTPHSHSMGLGYSQHVRYSDFLTKNCCRSSKEWIACSQRCRPSLQNGLLRVRR